MMFIPVSPKLFQELKSQGVIDEYGRILGHRVVQDDVPPKFTDHLQKAINHQRELLAKYKAGDQWPEVISWFGYKVPMCGGPEAVESYLNTLDSKQGVGLIVEYFQCPECLAAYRPGERSDECDGGRGHLTTCCGASLNELHKPGCENNPGFKLGKRFAEHLNRRVWEEFLKDAKEFSDLPQGEYVVWPDQAKPDVVVDGRKE